MSPFILVWKDPCSATDKSNHEFNFSLKEWGGSKTLVMVGQNQNKVVLNFDWWVMAKYISTHFDKFYVKLVCSGLPQGTSKRKIFSWGIWIGLLVAFGKYWEERRNPPKKCFFRKCDFSGTSKAFPRLCWSTSPWKPCVSAQKWCINIQHLLYLL